MNKSFGRLGVSLFLLAAVGCGSDGGKGEPGAKGEPGVAGEPGAAGATGADGKGTTPSFSVVFPRTGIVGRELDVVVTAEATTFDASTTLDFGDANIKVSDIQVVSPTTIFAHLTIAEAAVIGRKNVKIGGKVSLAGTGAFEVQPGIDVSVTGGTSEQGGLVKIDVANNDTRNAFDNTYDLFSGGYSNFLVLGAHSAAMSITSVTATGAQATLLLDPTAPAAGEELMAANLVSGGTALGTTYLSNAAKLKVAARAATPITGGALTGQVIAAPLSTQLYKFTAAATSIVDVSVTGAAKIAPQAWVYPASGLSQDLISTATGAAPVDPDPAVPATVTFPSLAAGDAYLVVHDGALGGGAAADYGFGVKVTATAATAYAEKKTGANAHKAVPAAEDVTAACFASKPCIISGAIGVAGEYDVYKVTLAKGDKIEIALTPESDAIAGVIGVDPADKNSVDLGDQAAAVASVSGRAHTASAVRTAAVAGPLYVLVLGQSGGAKPMGNYAISVRKLP